MPAFPNDTVSSVAALRSLPTRFTPGVSEGYSSDGSPASLRLPFHHLTVPVGFPSRSRLPEPLLALSPAGSYLTSFPRRWCGLWTDASASFLVVSSIESPFDFSGFPRHSSDNRRGSLACPIPLAVFSFPPRENFLNSRRLLSGSPKEVRTLFRCLFCTLSSPCGFYEAHT
jgi:hypothetical protein